MAAEASTRPGTMPADACLAGLDPERRAEAERLIEIFSDATGFRPVMWAGSLVGFGR